MSFRNKKESRLRRARRTRMRIRSLGAVRLSVFRSSRHIYAQIISPECGQVLVSCSTVDKAMKSTYPHGADVATARVVGTCLAEKAKAAGISKVAFDRSGYAYHGRVRALAEAAREAGLEF